MTWSVFSRSWAGTSGIPIIPTTNRPSGFSVDASAGPGSISHATTSLAKCFCLAPARKVVLTLPGGETWSQPSGTLAAYGVGEVQPSQLPWPTAERVRMVYTNGA